MKDCGLPHAPVSAATANPPHTTSASLPFGGSVLPVADTGTTPAEHPCGSNPADANDYPPTGSNYAAPSCTATNAPANCATPAARSEPPTSTTSPPATTTDSTTSKQPAAAATPPSQHAKASPPNSPAPDHPKHTPVPSDMTDVQRTCKTCGNTFLWASARPRGGGRPANYCSQRCRNYRPTQCAVCGSTVVRRAGRSKDHLQRAEGSTRWRRADVALGYVNAGVGHAPLSVLSPTPVRLAGQGRYGS